MRWMDHSSPLSGQVHNVSHTSVFSTILMPDFFCHHGHGPSHIEIHYVGSNTLLVLVVVSPRMFSLPLHQPYREMVSDGNPGFLPTFSDFSPATIREHCWFNRLIFDAEIRKTIQYFFCRFAMEMSNGGPPCLRLSSWLNQTELQCFKISQVNDDCVPSHLQILRQTILISFLFRLSILCVVRSAPQDHKPALIQEWCQSVGVIADEEGVAVEAIKAWGKELMGWWLGWRLEWGC